MTDRCTYCSNRATRNVGNTYKEPPNDVELVCEIHYAYLKPIHAKVNPTEIGRCMRCGCKSLNKRGDAERLIDHHVNYYLDLTVPLCDSCHQEVHAKTPKDRYLEATERQNEPYTPRGSDMQTGIAIHEGYRTNREPSHSPSCPDCGTRLIYPPEGMGIEDGFICPDSDCYTTEVKPFNTV